MKLMVAYVDVTNDQTFSGLVECDPGVAEILPSDVLEGHYIGSKLD